MARFNDPKKLAAAQGARFNKDLEAIYGDNVKRAQDRKAEIDAALKTFICPASCGKMTAVTVVKAKNGAELHFSPCCEEGRAALATEFPEARLE